MWRNKGFKLTYRVLRFIGNFKDIWNCRKTKFIEWKLKCRMSEYFVLKVKYEKYLKH